MREKAQLAQSVEVRTASCLPRNTGSCVKARVKPSVRLSGAAEAYGLPVLACTESAEKERKTDIGGMKIAEAVCVSREFNGSLHKGEGYRQYAAGTAA